MTQQQADLAVRKSVTVPRTPEQAFELFTARIAEWWPLATHSISEEHAAAAVIEPFAGGRVYERADSGQEHEWGEVLAWEPPHRFVMSWKLGREASTEQVEVRFSAAKGGTRVDLEHTGFGPAKDDARERRGNYDTGWDFVLGRFVAAV